jgi:rare lipoprotein A
MKSALVKIMVVSLLTLPTNSFAAKHSHKKSHITHTFYTKHSKKPAVIQTAKSKSTKGFTTKAVNSGLDGVASWYGPHFHGHKTASGERFNQNALTAAHKSIAMGSTVRVTNVKNHKSVVVTINDYGPHVRGRIIDLSKRAAANIDLKGVGMVHLEVLKKVDKS